MSALPNRAILSAMTVEDYDDVLALWHSSENLGKAESREEIATFLDRNPQLSPIARCDGHLAGAVLCGYDGRRGYLYHVAVAPEFRKQGIAQQLVGWCLDKLRDLGVSRCSVHLYIGNEDAERFWRRIGWRERTDLKLMARDL